MGIAPTVVQILDALRKQRNVTEYSGDLVPESTVRECQIQAESLLKLTRNWLMLNKAELL